MEGQWPQENNFSISLSGDSPHKLKKSLPHLTAGRAWLGLLVEGVEHHVGLGPIRGRLVRQLVLLVTCPWAQLGRAPLQLTHCQVHIGDTAENGDSDGEYLSVTADTMSVFTIL